MVRKRGRKAWLVTWETANNQPIEDPIAAVFSSRRSPETVKNYIEFLYSATHLVGEEKLQTLVDPSSNPYPATFGTLRVKVSQSEVRNVRWTAQIMCGHNPYLYARIVDNLRIGQVPTLTDHGSSCGTQYRAQQNRLIGPKSAIRTFGTNDVPWMPHQICTLAITASNPSDSPLNALEPAPRRDASLPAYPNTC